MRVKDLYYLLDRLISEDNGIMDRDVNVLVPDNSPEGYNEMWVRDWSCDADMNVQLICK